MKRFTETEKWRDPWFQKLDKESRTLWGWLCDRVDNAGVIDICWPICNAETLGSFTDESMNAFGDRVEKLDNGKWWIPKFIEFQVGKLSDHCKPHIYIINILKKHSLYDRVSIRVCNTFKEKDKDKEQEKDKEKDKDDGFNAFWKEYPKKVGKGDALKSWKKINPSMELKAKIMETIAWQKASKDWIKEDGKYIPNPATWLNQGRWDDEQVKQAEKIWT